MMRDLDVLASQARGCLVDKGCARLTIAHHGAAWKRLMSWCEDEGIGGHGHDAGRRLMEEVLTATEINQIGTAVGILDQDGTGRKTTCTARRGEGSR